MRDRIGQLPEAVQLHHADAATFPWPAGIEVVASDPPWKDLNAYRTLPGHVESGEERFLAEWDRGDDGVWYDILAFSRPNHVLTRLGYPVVRRLQKRFGRDSAAAMLRAVRPPERLPG